MSLFVSYPYIHILCMFIYTSTIPLFSPYIPLNFPLIYPRYQLAEWRVSIYGRNRDEWSNLSQWFYNNKLAHFNVRWLIQVSVLCCSV